MGMFDYWRTGARQGYKHRTQSDKFKRDFVTILEVNLEACFLA